jgi:hypothetical protein
LARSYGSYNIFLTGTERIKAKNFGKQLVSGHIGRPVGLIDLRCGHSPMFRIPRQVSDRQTIAGFAQC